MLLCIEAGLWLGRGRSWAALWFSTGTQTLWWQKSCGYGGYAWKMGDRHIGVSWMYFAWLSHFERVPFTAFLSWWLLGNRTNLDGVQGCTAPPLHPSRYLRAKTCCCLAVHSQNSFYGSWIFFQFSSDPKSQHGCLAWKPPMTVQVNIYNVTVTCVFHQEKVWVHPDSSVFLSNGFTLGHSLDRDILGESNVGPDFGCIYLS